MVLFLDSTEYILPILFFIKHSGCCVLLPDKLSSSNYSLKKKKKEIKGNKDGYFIKHNIMKFMLKNTLASFLKNGLNKTSEAKWKNSEDYDQTRVFKIPAGSSGANDKQATNWFSPN